jgi:hypothetical protein
VWCGRRRRWRQLPGCVGQRLLSTERRRTGHSGGRGSNRASRPAMDTQPLFDRLAEGGTPDGRSGESAGMSRRSHPPAVTVTIRQAGRELDDMRLLGYYTRPPDWRAETSAATLETSAESQQSGLRYEAGRARRFLPDLGGEAERSAVSSASTLDQVTVHGCSESDSKNRSTGQRDQKRDRSALGWHSESSALRP